MEWKILDSVDQLNQLLLTPDVGTFAIFKHSTRCSISTMSKNRIERNWDELPGGFNLYYLDLLTFRQVSDAISQQLGVEHESPQLLLVENGKCVFHSSHSSIDITELTQIIKLSQN